MLRAVIYARYSSENQRDESIDAQVRLCKDYIKSKGYILTHVYADEAISGRTDDRAQFQQMLTDAKAGLFDVVVTDKVDRFARDKCDSAVHKRYLRKKCGVRVEYASQRIDETPEGMMLESVLESLAEYYSMNLARETMKGLTENALRGWHTGGIPPFGLKVVSRVVEGKEVKTYDIDPDQAAVVQRIFEIYDAGGTYGDIQAATKEDMIRLRGRPLSKNSIHDILRNEKYTGTFVFNKGTKKEHKRTRPDVIRVPNAFPAIISRELWERVQAKMDKRKRSPGERAQNKSKRVFLLTGLIYCGKCGAAVVGNSGRGRDKKRRSYYECNVKQRSKECDLKNISADIAEQIVIEDIQKVLFSKEGKAHLKKQFEKYLTERPKKIKEKEESIRREIAGLDRKINNIVAAVEEGRSTAALLDRLDLYEEHKKDLQLQLLNLEAKEKKPISLEEVETLLKKAEKEIQDRSDPQRLKNLIRLFVDRVTVFDDGIEVKLKITPSTDPEGVSDTAGSPNPNWIVSETFYNKRATRNIIGKELPERTLGEKIRKQRYLKGLTAAELGRLCGCATVTINFYESDTYFPSYDVMKKICTVLDVPVTYFEDDYYNFVLSDDYTNYLRRWRKENADSIDDVKKILGVSYSTYCEWEKGKRMIRKSFEKIKERLFK